MSGLQPASATSRSSLQPSTGSKASDARKVSFQPTSAAPSRSSSAYLPWSGTASTTGADVSSSSQSAQSAYAGVTRRHSLFGTEDRIVLDIGSRYSKFGFSGEPRPRAIVPSFTFSQPSTSYLRLESNSTSSSFSSEAATYNIGDTLWDLDFERCTDDQLRRGKRALVLAQLTQLLRNAFAQHLMVDPKQRKVLVVENPMLPNSIKEMICKVLFNNLQVPSVSFVPAPLLSLLAVGKITGLVLEIGYLESTLMPVYYGRPLTSHTVSSPRAGKRLNARLKQMLLHYGKFVAAQTSLQDSAKSIKERTHPIDPALLTDERLEQIKAKALFVSSHEPSLAGLDELFSSLELAESSDAQIYTGTDATASIRKKYSSVSSATPFTFAVSPESIEPHGTASLIQSISAASSSSASHFAGAAQKNGATGVIAIPGWVRERAAELLFEPGDDDDPGLVEMTVAAIVKLPIDLRRTMCENILVSGGTAMLPGFAHRFRTQLAAAVEMAERAGGELSIDIHVRLLGKRMKGTEEQEERKAERAGRGLHGSIAVLNDPWPELSLSQSSKESGNRGGAAPAFAANLLAWMGASLAGALKTTSLNAVSREAYDEAAKSVQDQLDATAATAVAQDKAGKENGMRHQARGSSEEGGGDGKQKSPTSRPSMMSASKRGSFVGVVGGLETGAYGGLAAVSRHLIGVTGGAGAAAGTSNPCGKSPNAETADAAAAGGGAATTAAKSAKSGSSRAASDGGGR